MVTVKIDKCDLLDMLMDRLAFWTTDDVKTKLFERYYWDMIEGGCFDETELDVQSIVDNDYVNYLDVIYEEDFDNYNIENENDERIILADTDNDGNKVYLIYTC